VARKKSPTLTEAELRLMAVIWDKRAATVGEVLAGLPDDTALAYSTVLTTLRILETKGYVAHSESGRAFVYRPLIGRDEARRNATQQLVRRFFDNSPGLLALSLLEQENIDDQELQRLKRLIERRKENS
jgi:BlaI family transcriptional regulator, penicillinase repressor